MSLLVLLRDKFQILNKSMRISVEDVAIVTIRVEDNKIHFWFMTKNEAVDRMKNADLSEESGRLWF